MKNQIQSIRKRREENEKDEIICIREINQNIKNVIEGKPLTRPLAVLNKNCEFKKRYDIAFDLINEEKIKEEIKAKKKEYNQRPEIKAKIKEYQKEYQKEYRKRPEIKAKIKEYRKKYYQRNKKQILKKLKEKGSKI